MEPPKDKSMDQFNLEQRYFDLQKTAFYLGLSVKTIYKWVELGKIPAYKLGHVWRFDRLELDQFVHGVQANDFSTGICYNGSSVLMVR